MKHPWSVLGGCLAGALAMYYLDPRTGAYRRSLVRDKTVGACHDAASLARAKGKRAADRVKGVVATGRLDRVTSRPPESDHQLHERIRARIGRLVSHPRLLEVSVEQGRVSLGGHVLRSEIDHLMADLRAMPGVAEVHSELQVHGRAHELQNIPAPRRQAAMAQATEPAPQAQPQPLHAWH